MGAWINLYVCSPTYETAARFGQFWLLGGSECSNPRCPWGEAGQDMIQSLLAWLGFAPLPCLHAKCTPLMAPSTVTMG